MHEAIYKVAVRGLTSGAKDKVEDRVAPLV